MDVCRCMAAKINPADFGVVCSSSHQFNSDQELPPLEQLRTLPIGELRRLWLDRLEHGLEVKPPRVKALIARDLAWHAQQGSYGGFNAQTLSLLTAAVRPYLTDTARESADRTGTRKPGRRRAHQAKAKLPGGTQLVRSWRGVEHTVTVLEDGKSYHYRDQTYRSLTVIAEQITGAHWSGPRFFGLNQIRSIR